MFVRPDDLADLGFADGQFVDLVSEWTDGVEPARRALPGRLLPDRAGLRGRLLPGDQRAGAAGQHRRGQQHADLEVGGDPAGGEPGVSDSDAERRTGGGRSRCTGTAFPSRSFATEDDARAAARQLERDGWANGIPDTLTLTRRGDRLAPPARRRRLSSAPGLCDPFGNDQKPFSP